MARTIIAVDSTTTAATATAAAGNQNGTGYGGNAGEDERTRKAGRKAALKRETQAWKSWQTELEAFGKQQQQQQQQQQQAKQNAGTQQPPPPSNILNILKEALRQTPPDWWWEQPQRQLYTTALQVCSILTEQFPKAWGDPDDDESPMSALNELAQTSELLVQQFNRANANTSVGYSSAILPSATTWLASQLGNSLQTNSNKNNKNKKTHDKDPELPTRVVQIRDQAAKAVARVLKTPECSMLEVHDFYRQALRPLAFGTVEIFDKPKQHYGPGGMYERKHGFRAADDAFGNTTKPKSTKACASGIKISRALWKELSTYPTALPIEYGSSIFVRTLEHEMDKLRVLIIGPNDTPYANGCFLFDVFMGNDFPHKPPQVQFLTTSNFLSASDEHVRFNPNLYADGKVCLSLLGTWSGPGWQPNESTLLQVLISIQSLILGVAEPYYNEPGFERSQGTASGKREALKYNKKIRRQTLQVAILPFLQNQLRSDTGRVDAIAGTANGAGQRKDPPGINAGSQQGYFEEFSEVFEKHFRLKQQIIQKQLFEWLQDDKSLEPYFAEYWNLWDQLEQQWAVASGMPNGKTTGAAKRAAKRAKAVDAPCPKAHSLAVKMKDGVIVLDDSDYEDNVGTMKMSEAFVGAGGRNCAIELENSEDEGSPKPSAVATKATSSNNAIELGDSDDEDSGKPIALSSNGSRKKRKANGDQTSLKNPVVLLLLCCLLLVPVSADKLHANLSVSSMEQILKNTVNVDLPRHHKQGSNYNSIVTIPLPCNYLGGAKNATFTTYVQESTASMLAAKALAKTFLVEEKESDSQNLDVVSWDMLDAALLLPRESKTEIMTPKEKAELSRRMFYQAQGLLPKYWYIHASDNRAQKSHYHRNGTLGGYYVTNTRFPHWSLFSFPGVNHEHNETFLQSSHRLSAPPFHASILWDMMCAVIPPRNSDGSSSNTEPFPISDEIENQKVGSYSYNYDHNKNWWNRVERYYDRIYQNHFYIHEVVMRGCQLPPSGTDIPCYNIIHPWESLMDPTSPSWNQALAPIVKEIRQRKWKLPLDKIPLNIQKSYDFPDSSSHVYEAMMYLFLEGGWTRVDTTRACQSDLSFSDPNQVSSCGEDAFWAFKKPAKDVEGNSNDTISAWAMLDVGYASLLAQADADLHRLARVLKTVLPQNYFGGATRHKLEQQLTAIKRWREENRALLENGLWNDRHSTYQSKFYNATSGRMEFLSVAVSNNLLPFWYSDGTKSPEEGEDEHKHMANSNEENSTLVDLAKHHWKDVALQLIRREGRFAFDCGPYPLWSQGCSQYRASATPELPMIQPLVNYLIANGLLQNDDNFLDTFGRYISSQSLHLINAQSNNVTNAAANVDDSAIFGEMYSAFWPYQNLATLDRCGNTSTLTAAIAYNLLIPDPSHLNRLPLPPIQRGWVITLITVELFMAFSIGVSCLLLSLNLIHKTRLDDDWLGDNRAPMIRALAENGYEELGLGSDHGQHYDATTRNTIDASPEG